MKTSLVISLLFLSNLIFAQTGWFALNSGTSLNLNDIQFINDLTGYVCGGGISTNSPGIVKKTTDGGVTWFTLLNTASVINSLYFIDVNTGTVVGWISIRRTTNGGTSWTSQNPPVSCSGYYRSIFFLNSNVGVIAGDVSVISPRNGIILFTSNGGLTWLDRCYATDAVYFGVQVFDPNTAIVVGTSGAPGSIIKTTNFGISWIAQNIGGVFRGVSFVNNNNGLVSGSGTNNIGKTTNGGNNWSFQTISNTFSFNGVYYIDTSIAYTVGITGAIWKTSNGGLNWLQQTSGTPKTLRAVHFINPNTGWACGDTGVLIKTTNGGITAILPISNEIPNKFSLSQNYPNPFNPTTKIQFQIPKTPLWQRGDNVRLVVFDVLGREVATLVNEQLQPGTYEVDFDGSKFGSGVYYYKLTANDFTETKKMVLIK